MRHVHFHPSSLLHSLYLSSVLSFSPLHSLPSDYIYVPAQSTYTVPEGEQTEVSFVLDNPPPDGVFEFDYNVVLSTADGSATGMPD